MPPADASTLFQQAMWHMGEGRAAMAAEVCEQAVRADPRHFESRSLLGAIYLTLGRNADARRVSEKALALRPRDPRPHQQIASSYLHEGRFEDVDRILARAFRDCGRNPILVGVQAERLVDGADYEGAYQACRPVLEAGSLDAHLVISAARACTQTGRHGEGAALVRACLAKGEPSAMARSALLYALAEALDAMGEYDSAFIAAKEANDLKNKAPPPIEQSAAIDRYIAAWSREAIAALPRAKPTDLPVFIVGFWRSGTTLVEQTLASHPRVFGAGELLDILNFAHERHDPRIPRGEPLIMEPESISRAAVERFARAHLERLRRLAPKAARVTDKLPVNFVHLGLISALFPGARVIHCTRNPVDTCVSCYFNLQGGIPYAHDLRALGSFYRDYLRLMRHWRSVLDIPMIEVAYEDLVADHPAHARRLVEFLDLPWDDACLRPHENTRVALTQSIHQVRKPVYGSSVARWKRYERHLGPLLEALGDAGPRSG